MVGIKREYYKKLLLNAIQAEPNAEYVEWAKKEVAKIEEYEQAVAEYRERKAEAYKRFCEKRAMRDVAEKH